MDRAAPASRDHRNPVQGPPAQGAPRHHDAAGYQRQPQPYGPLHAGTTGSSSSSQNGRHAALMNPAESGPANYSPDDHHLNKRPRLGWDQDGQHRPQYDGSYASHYPPPPGSSSAGPPQRPLAPRPSESASLPRFSVPIMDPSPSYSATLPPPAPHQQPFPNFFSSRSDLQHSSVPSPPLISPLNGSPYSRRESTLSGSVPAVPSPSSSHSSAREDGRANPYSVHGQNQGAPYLSSAPPTHRPPPTHGTPINDNGHPPPGPMPQQPPPMQQPYPTDGYGHKRERERQYPFHGVPYSGGPIPFLYSQPYNTLSQQWAPTLPSDFEDREAYCDSRGVIRSAQHPTGDQNHPHYEHHQYQEHPGHPGHHEQYPQRQNQDPTVHYEQQHDQLYKQQGEQQHQQHQHHENEMFRQQQSEHQPHQDTQNQEHHEGQAPNEPFAQQNGPEHDAQLEDEDDVRGWEPEIKPEDIKPEKAKADATKASPDSAPENEQAPESTTVSLPTSAQSSPPAPPRSAPLHDILHPFNKTPLLEAAEILVPPANDVCAVASIISPPVKEAEPWGQYSEPGSPEPGSPRYNKPERRQRGTFTQEQRDETSQTRTYGACLRCKSQRVRCVPSPLGPYDMCMTCEQVSRNSKKVLHTIRCVRWRLTSMTTYRSGGLELTKRWEGTEVHNVGDWVSDDIKEIDMKLYYSSHMHRYDLCDTPVKLRIREFAPLPDDVLTRKWSKRVVDKDGTPKIEKKVAILPAFALADVDEAEQALDSYFKTNLINAMYDATRHCMPIIREHYHAAIRHYQSFPDGDFEKTFLEKFFRLWFYTRSSYISGGDKLGCKPITDPDYPLGTRISVPRMITAQCDSIMVTKFLKPLSQGLILELEKIFRTGNPDNWFTLYICTFMLLGEVSFSSQDRRRHGTDNWITDTPYSLYEFVSDLQFSGNILLCYWHYYRTMDPMDAGWDIFCQIIEPPLEARETIESAKGKGKKKVHVTVDQRQLVMAHWPKMVELAEILSTVHHNKSFEHPLYFVSQMYMREWEIREVYSYTPPGCDSNTRLNKTTRR